jgi:hypothetical protein
MFIYMFILETADSEGDAVTSLLCPPRNSIMLHSGLLIPSLSVSTCDIPRSCKYRQQSIRLIGPVFDRLGSIEGLALVPQLWRFILSHDLQKREAASIHLYYCYCLWKPQHAECLLVYLFPSTIPKYLPEPFNFQSAFPTHKLPLFPLSFTGSVIDKHFFSSSSTLILHLLV